MMREFFRMSSAANTPHPSMPDRRRAIFGSAVPVGLPMQLWFDLSGGARARAVVGHDLDLIRRTHAESELHGARDLLLLKDRAARHFRRRAVVPEQRDADRVHR